MKKSFIICIFATIIGLGAVSCNNKSDEEEVKEYAVGFADKASKNQIDSLKLVYPGIENADSIALKYVAEGIVVNPSEEGNQYEVILSPEVTIWMNVNEDGTYTVTESKGLFAYPQDKMDIADKAGVWDENINDVERSKKIAKAYQNYLDNISAGLTFQTICHPEKVEGVTLQTPYSPSKLENNLKSLGFKLTDTKKEYELDHYGEEYVAIPVKTFSKTVGNLTTMVSFDDWDGNIVKLEIYFPTEKDLEEFRKTVKGKLHDDKVYYWSHKITFSGTKVTIQSDGAD